MQLFINFYWLLFINLKERSFEPCNATVVVTILYKLKSIPFLFVKKLVDSIDLDLKSLV